MGDEVVTIKPHDERTRLIAALRAASDFIYINRRGRVLIGIEAACADLVDKTLADVDTADFNAYKEACDNAC